jgi:hypothetical protein
VSTSRGAKNWNGEHELKTTRIICGLGVAAALINISTARSEPKPDPTSLAVVPIKVDARLIDHFDKSDPGKTAFGKLEFRGGLLLTSDVKDFGGWSALALDPDGRRLLAISDTGVWMTGELTYAGSKPTGIRNAKLGPLLGLNGQPPKSERDRDSEGVTVIDGSLARGTVLISFERNHRIARFPVSDQGVGRPTELLALPPETKRQSSNKSLESVCTIAGGQNKGAIVTLSERFPNKDGSHTGWMYPGTVSGGINAATTATGWTTLSIRNIGEYDLTDCVGLPDGSLLVLERRFRWSSWFEGVKSRLRRFKADEIRAGRMMEGEVLLDADLSQEIDNLEGMAVHKSAKGETVITLISDNNFNTLLQKTLLLQFTLNDPALTEPVKPIPVVRK